MLSVFSGLILLGLVIVKFAIIWLRLENAGDLRNGSYDGASVRQLPVWQNVCSDDVYHVVATLHFLEALYTCG